MRIAQVEGRRRRGGSRLGGRKIAHEFAKTLADAASRVAKVLLALGLLSDDERRRHLGAQPFFENLEKDFTPAAKATFGNC